MALCLASCTKENPIPELRTEYSLKVTIAMKEIAQQKISYDAQLSDKFIFYEYNESNMQVASNVWSNPREGEEKSFIANDSATKFTVCYEINGTKYDGTPVSMSIWLADVFSLTNGQKTSAMLTASTPTKNNNPI